MEKEVIKRPIDLAIEIIRLTNDGNDLSPFDLRITEAAANGDLNTKGIDKLRELHTNVTKGAYDKLKIYHLGVEHMTKDHQGYIFFKGHSVEHFSYTNIEDERRALMRLQRLCLMLESKKIQPSVSTVVWDLEKYLSPEEIKTTQH